jgi:hypothetical protein
MQEAGSWKQELEPRRISSALWMNAAANKPMLKVAIGTNVFISAFYLPGSRPAEMVFT